MHGAIFGGTVPERSMIKSIKSEIVPLDEEALFRSLAKAAANRVRSS